MGGRETYGQRVKRDARYREENYHKMKARWAVNDAIKLGKFRRGPCERLGPDCSGRIQGHHDDYTKPLEVRWLCRKHHHDADRVRPPGVEPGT